MLKATITTVSLEITEQGALRRDTLIISQSRKATREL